MTADRNQVDSKSVVGRNQVATNDEHDGDDDDQTAETKTLGAARPANR